MSIRSKVATAKEGVVNFTNGVVRFAKDEPYVTTFLASTYIVGVATAAIIAKRFED